MLFYGPHYTNELLTSNSSEWIVATTIEMMIATGLAVGYKPSGTGRCWYQKGFLDIDSNVAFGEDDPLVGIGTLHRQCFCRSYEPQPASSPPLQPPPTLLPPLTIVGQEHDTIANGKSAGSGSGQFQEKSSGILYKGHVRSAAILHDGQDSSHGVAVPNGRILNDVPTSEDGATDAVGAFVFVLPISLGLAIVLSLLCYQASPARRFVFKQKPRAGCAFGSVLPPLSLP